MADELIIEVDASEILAMLEALGPAAETHVREASRITADRIQQEARSRARRATGILQAAIEVEEMGPPLGGFRVYVDEMTDARGRRPQEFAGWHEFGTKKMGAQPFMNSSATLEEGPHLRRISEALQDAIDQENS